MQPPVPYGGCPAADIFVLVGNAGRALAADLTACLAAVWGRGFAAATAAPPVTEARLAVLHARWVPLRRHHRLLLSLAAGPWAGWVAAAASALLDGALARLSDASPAAVAAWAALATAPDAAAALPPLWAAVAEALLAGAAAAAAAEGILPAVVASAAAKTGRGGGGGMVRAAAGADGATVRAAAAAHGNPADAVYVLCRGAAAADRAALAARLCRHAPEGGGGRRRKGGKRVWRRGGDRRVTVAAAAASERGWEGRQAGALRFLATPEAVVRGPRGGGRAAVPPLALVTMA